MSSTRSVPSCYKQDKLGVAVSTYGGGFEALEK
jgi:hypothetical protein